MAKTTITGRLTFIGPSEIRGMLEIRQSRIEEEGQYGTVMEVAWLSGKGTQLDSYKVGDMVTIHADVRGRKNTHNGRDFYNTNLTGWKVERVASAPPRQKEPPKETDWRDSYQQQVKSQVPELPAGTDIDDLPF